MDQSEVTVRDSDGVQHKIGLSITHRPKSSKEQEQPSRGEEVDAGNDGRAIGSMSREGKDKEVVGTDGMEMEEGCSVFVSFD